MLRVFHVIYFSIDHNDEYKVAVRICLLWGRKPREDLLIFSMEQQEGHAVVIVIQNKNEQTYQSTDIWLDILK